LKYGGDSSNMKVNKWEETTENNTFNPINLLEVIRKACATTTTAWSICFRT
jgi:hypothetical protein